MLRFGLRNVIYCCMRGHIASKSTQFLAQQNCRVVDGQPRYSITKTFIFYFIYKPILTRTDEEANSSRPQRETMFTSLQQKFRVYGVDLRRTHPYIYAQLIKWVENGGLFPHMTFYPKNSAGVDFLCILAGGKIQQWHPIHT